MGLKLQMGHAVFDTSGLRLPSPVASQAGLTAVPVVLSLSTLTLSQLRSFAAWSETASVTAITESAPSVVAEAPAQLLRVSAEGALEDRSMSERLRCCKRKDGSAWWPREVRCRSFVQHLCFPEFGCGCFFKHPHVEISGVCSGGI